MKSLFLWIITIAYAFIAYLFIFGVFVFLIDVQVPTELEYDSALFKTPSADTQYAYLVEARQYAFDLRLALIHHAEETIDISYYAVHEGRSRDIFFGALLDAADRGVFIRFIVDGFIEGRGFNDSSAMKALASHPNITIANYEIFDLRAPYAVQNRLHDKLIIVDAQYGLIGGRNIGDRYYFDDSDLASPTHDRDVLIFGHPSVAVKDMSDYYDYLFNHPYSSILTSDVTADFTPFTSLYNQYLSESNLVLTTTMDAVHDNAFKVDNVSFIRSPLDRFNKTPVVFNTLIELALDYDDFIVQSPYIILSQPMREMFKEIRYERMVLLTNHPYTNPNIFAVSGYLRVRQDLATQTTLFEYQKPLSLHTKTIIMGDDISVIGSINIDPRSVFLSTESVVIIYDKAFNAHMRETIETYLQDSLQVDQDLEYIEGSIEPIQYSNSRRLLAHLFKYLTYFFDQML